LRNLIRPKTTTLLFVLNDFFVYALQVSPIHCTTVPLEDGTRPVLRVGGRGPKHGAPFHLSISSSTIV
jgi:hypothetical protein